MDRAGTHAGGSSGTADDERELVAALQAGDEAAYETLVRTHAGRMLAVARRLLPNGDDAEEAVQRAFIMAHKGLPDFQADARLSTWLHRIVVNAALMMLRSRRRRHEIPIDDLLPRFEDSESEHHLGSIAPWRRTAEDDALLKETRATVRGAIDRLPPNYRDVLLLRDIEQLDTAQTGETLGLTSNAVKTRLHRARLALRALLDPHFRNDPA
ncbi:MAG: RNA polymerase sigma factor [Planctomycetota bacterium]|jgi:RNA polymerase sigma-70 factor (ECF subfamily)